MAYNHGKEERKWRLWKEAEEKILRAYGVDENIIEEIRIYDRAEFNSDRRFYRRLNDMEEYIEKVADNGLNTEIKQFPHYLMKLKMNTYMLPYLRWTSIHWKLSY